MIAFPPAKINLGLNVIEKRPDLFHNIETVFCAVQWCDILEIVKSDEFKFSQSGLSIDGNVNDNLCTKAYELLMGEFNLNPVHIYLHKCIPMGAGLGGGSSDAVYTLKLLNDIFKLNLTIAQLLNYAIKLGSDCAFFLHDDAMFAEGRGDVLSKIKLTTNGYFICIVMPPIEVKTVQAFSQVVPSKPALSIKEIIGLPIVKWKDCLKNDFEETVFKTHPVIKKMKEDLYSNGALYASMSGSGAAVFGIFNKPIDLNNMFSKCSVWYGKL